MLKKTNNSRKRVSSESLPTLDPNSCNGSKKSKLESKVISALVAYGSDSSDDENLDEENQKCTILQRLQEKAEMFKLKELNKSNEAESLGSCETNSQPDILDIIGKEVPPDYVVEKPNVQKSLEKKSNSGDIFDILKSEVPPDYIDETTNNNIKEDNTSVVLSDSKVIVKLESKLDENDTNSKYHLNTDERTRTTSTILDSSKENNSVKSFDLIANYGNNDHEDSSKNNFYSIKNIVLNINVFIGIVFLFTVDDQKTDLSEKSFSYAQDPCANVKTGFGYSVSSKHKNGGSINFIKGETINLQNSNQNSDKYNGKKQQKVPINNCDAKGNACNQNIY